MKLLGFSLLIFGLQFGAQGGTEVASFDARGPEQAPLGWKLVNARPVAPVRWEVHNDQKAPFSPKVLVLTSHQRDRRAPALAIFEKVDLHDGDVSMDFKLDPNKRSQTVGILFGYRDPQNYYLANASADASMVSLVRVQAGVTTPLTPVSPGLMHFCLLPHHIMAQDWNLMRVRIRGPRIAFFLGHRKLMEARDDSYTGSGKTGIWSRGDTVAYVDNFRVDKKN